MKNMARGLASCFGLKQLVSLSGQPILLPFYHVVADEEKPHYSELYPIKTVSEFEAELDFLLANFEPISLSELIGYIKGGKKPKGRKFHLSFDDGLAELYNTVAPILRKKGVPATFFVNTDFIDNEKLFYRFKANLLAAQFGAYGALDIPFKEKKDLDVLCETLGLDVVTYLNVQQPYLTSEQIQSLIEDGFTIGAHSKNHPYYHKISLDEQIEQTVGSTHELVQNFNLPYKVFSFPFTDYGVGAQFYKKINDKLDLTFGTAGIRKDFAVMNLQRVPMETNVAIAKHLKYHYFKAFIQKMFGSNKIRR